MPVSAVKRRAKVRSETWAWAASVRTVSGSWRRSRAQARVAASEPPGCVGSGCSTYWAWPPSRCGRDDEAAGDAAGERGAVVAAQHVQAEVEPGGDAGGGQDVAFVDVEHVGLDVDRG